MKTFTEFTQLYQNTKSGDSDLLFPNNKIRDLSVIDLFNDFSLIIACDSDGAIGSKPNDVVRCSNYMLGRFAARVPLMEILAAGAVPISIIDTLTVEMEPSGREIISGILDEASAAGIKNRDIITGSTEDNIPTSQTGIGVTVIGIIHRKNFRPGSSKPGDIIATVGFPKSGPEDKVVLDDPEIVTLSTVRSLAKSDFIHDILPVGSKGIAYEASQLAESANLSLSLIKRSSINLTKSAGPSTCILASLAKSSSKKLTEFTQSPIYIIGELN